MLNIHMYKCKLISNYIEHWKAIERLSNERLTLPWGRGQTPLQLSNQDTNTRVKAQKKAWLLPQACGPDLQGAWGDQSSCLAFCTHKWATSFWQCHIPVTLINLCVYSMSKKKERRTSMYQRSENTSASDPGRESIHPAILRKGEYSGSIVDTI